MGSFDAINHGKGIGCPYYPFFLFFLGAVAYGQYKLYFFLSRFQQVRFPLEFIPYTESRKIKPFVFRGKIAV